MRQEKIKVSENLSEKRILDMTGEDLLVLFQQLVVTREEDKQPSSAFSPSIPPLATGIKELARVLGVSMSKIVRLKASGDIDDCIFQNGKIVIFDTHKVLDVLRLSNQKDKYGQSKFGRKIKENK